MPGIRSGASATIAFVPHQASSTPIADPTPDSKRLSVSSRPNETRTARAERGTRTHLGVARRGFAEQQRGDVDARDEKQQTDSAEQHEQRRANVAGLVAHEVGDANASARARIGSR